MVAISAASRILLFVKEIYSKRNVFADRFAEQESILRDVSNRTAQTFERVFANRTAVD